MERVIPLRLKQAAKGQWRSPVTYLTPSPRRLDQFQPQTDWITGKHINLSETVLLDTKIKLDLASLSLT